MSEYPRIYGSETEYGIVAVGEDPQISPIVTSTQAVVAYAELSGQSINRRTRWDYGHESPLRDARGFDLRRYRSDAAPVLEPNALGAANVITPSGARFYVDHAHPEYSAPETTSAYDAVVWDRAGDVVMHRAAQAAGSVEGQPSLKIYKNNVDGKGASYGAHENYLYPRQWDTEAVHAALVPHFVTRQVLIGAGRVGLGPTGAEAGFQISQRADYIETEVSLETTLNRGIINTRDEPHATADRWRRLHVIIGDANLSEFASYLKFGTTALVLAAAGQGVDFSDLALVDPVAGVQAVSRDLSCTRPLRLYGQVEMTAIEIQREIRARVAAAGCARTADDQQVLALWGQLLADLERDPLSTADRLDWTAKLALLNGYRQRGLEWTDPRLALVDIQYSDIDPQRSLYQALVRKGRMRTLVDPEDVARAVNCAPVDTRAHLRGAVVAAYADHVLAVNWDQIVLDCPCAGRPATVIRMPEPLSFTAAELGDVPLDGSVELPDLVAALRRIRPDAVDGVG
ncbi:depupylase/deamidase Dop [Corynebacterium heidelbergense]|uniref:Proteasome accessory factor PafA2 n=1 Tax=Corynebacterium heidelbergense TaxID=2055947 RepID=A0A364V4F0_9CORY|nr:depupylase/deamidase Dop [Corynebacterium heidelbergense]RAV31499.1 proteasome accessory factor PafA2 [Corynebacterium heidelbergense]